MVHVVRTARPAGYGVRATRASASRPGALPPLHPPRRKSTRSGQPPMVVIGREVFRTISSTGKPACLACFFCRAPPTSTNSSSSLAPPRSASRRESSSEPKRQTLRLPSAVRRSRLHPLQKGWVIEDMNETVPTAPGSRQETATSCLSVGTDSIPSKVCCSVCSTARCGTIVSSSQLLPPKGMYSMKRTSIGLARVRRAKSSISCSFCPAISTQFTLRGLMPSSMPRSIPRSTLARPSRRVSETNASRLSVSSEMLSLSRPAA
mmetsp:Transcript_11044/g.18848  ORF Transcript_11044/g.18848 Transcript_11044/m.18848 type:complete len:263 (-) Transcript_11044:630-1418(-)